MRHIDVDVRVKRRLRAAARRVLRAVAPGAVGAEHRIHGGLERFQRPLLVQAHRVCIDDTLDVRAATPVREHGVPDIRGLQRLSEGP